MAYTDSVNRGNQYFLGSDGETVKTVGIRDLVQPTVLAVGSSGSDAPLANRPAPVSKVRNINSSDS